MRREIVQDAVLLSGFVFSAIILLSSDANRWLVVLGGVVVVLQALQLVRRIRRLEHEDPSAPH